MLGCGTGVAEPFVVVSCSLASEFDAQLESKAAQRAISSIQAVVDDDGEQGDQLVETVAHQLTGLVAMLEDEDARVTEIEEMVC